jgi:DNA-binding CsgD family transcriptional regulator
MPRCLDLLQQPALQFFEQTSFPMAVQDEAGVAVWVNESLCVHFSVERDAVLGRPIAPQLPETARAEYLEWSRTWRVGVATPGRIVIHMRNGERRAHWVLGQPISDADGRPTGGAVLTILDERLLGEAIAHSYRQAARIVEDVLASLAKEADRVLELTDPALVDLADQREALSSLGKLSDREWSIAIRIGRGDRTSAIASDLGISASTVRNHLKAIYRKTGLASQVELARRVRGWRHEVGSAS